MSEAIFPKQAIEQENYQAKDWTSAKVIYTGLMAFNLLSFLWLLVTKADIELPAYILLPRIAAAFLAIWLGKLWKDKGFWILAAYTVLFVFRVFIPNPSDIFASEMSQSILSAIWLFAACYGIGRILTIRQIKCLLLICSTIWTVGMSVLCCMGIYVVWTEQPIKLLGTANICLFSQAIQGVYYNRLELVYVATVSSALMSTTILIWTISIICLKKRVFKAMILLLLPIIITTALTDSRTAYISTSAGLAIIAFSGIFIHTRQKETVSTKRTYTLKPWFYGLLIMAIVFVLVLLCFLQITPLFNKIRAQGIIPRALAEETSKRDLSMRGLDGYALLSGRTELWAKVIEYISQNKLVLLTGKSKQVPFSGFEDFFSHCHCLYLQVLLESGIPGLMLLLLFILYTMINSLKAIKNPQLPLWIRLLPALPAALWIADIVECFTWLRSSQCPMNTVLFISAGILNAFSQNKNKYI